LAPTWFSMGRWDCRNAEGWSESVVEGHKACEKSPGTEFVSNHCWRA
jgi:hypothetical protein